MADKGKKVYDSNARPTKTGGMGGSLQMAAQRRISKKRGETPSGGKSQLSPQNGRHAGSMITPNPKNRGGVVSTFVREKYRGKRH